MSITDELRMWAEGGTLRAGMSVHTACDQVLAIADRIDAEHEEALGSKVAMAIAAGEDGTEFVFLPKKELSECYIELPKDADGEPIHVGDVMEWPNGKMFDVVGIGDGVLFYIENADGPADWTGASTKRHHHAPTVEDVLREFAQRWDDPMRYDRDELVEQYAAKLRLADDGEEQ